MRGKINGSWMMAVKRVLGMALAVSFMLESAVYAAGADVPAGASGETAESSVLYAAASDTAKTPAVSLTGTTGQIVKVEILKGGADGTHLTTLTDTAPDALLLERRQEYTLSISVHKTSVPNTAGYVRLRFGNEDADGITYNGLVFQNPPGSLYTTGAFDGHSSLDAVTVRQDAPNPTYGTKPTAYSMQDGVFIYHEKDELPASSEITFYMQFTVDDVGYDGSGWLTDGLQLQTGRMTDGVFAADATLTASLPVESKPELKGAFNGTSKTATLGGNGQILTYYTQEVNNATEYLGMLYQKSEFDIVYPKGAEIGDLGFNTSYNKSDTTRGELKADGAPTEKDGVMTQHFVTTCGYKDETNDPAYYYYLTFPADSFENGQKVTTTLCNMTYTYLTGTGAEKTIQAQPPATQVTYSIVDPVNDSTTMAVVNRTTGDGVFNITSVTDEPAQALISLGGCRITNTVSTETPFEKTYEAQFNTTNTAAAITYVTVPLGTSESPRVWLTGKKNVGGTITTVTEEVEDPLASRLNKRNCLLFRAADYGFTVFTAVKAEIGKLPGGTDTSSWTSNFDLSANYSGAYGYFTTDEPGIVVKNTYRLYNTEPEHQQNTNGDLSVTSQTVSSTEARVGFSGTDATITNEKGSTIPAVEAGGVAVVSGTVYPYQVPYAEGYRTSNGASANVYGNASAITDPVLFVTLPAGMTLNTDDLYFRVNKYSYLNEKTTYDYLTAEKDYTVENISYMNQSSQDMNLYRITFSGLTLGYLAEGEDANAGKTTMLRKQLYYKLKLKTSKGLETQTYYITDLLGISSADPVTALPYSNAQSLCTVIRDQYGINGGRPYAATIPEKNRDTGFGVQRQAEININNAVAVDKIDGSAASTDLLSYDATDPNSILMMGRKTTGQYRLRVTNTSTLPSEDVTVLVPLPEAGKTLGAAFMYDDPEASKTFAFSMDVTWQESNLAGFEAQYVILNENIELWNQTVEPEYTVCTKDTMAQANAILLTRATASASTTYEITLDYTVDTNENLPNKLNLFRNIFRYRTGGTTYSGLGSYVACEIAEGKLSGTAFYDEDRNGVQDSGEDPLPGVGVVIKDGQGKTLSTTTDENGFYKFSAIREEEISATYDLGTNTSYRFNVAAEGLTPAADKKSAAAYYATLPENATLNIPLSTYWTLTYDGNGATSGLVPAAQEYDPDDAVATVRVKPDNLYRKYYAFNGWNTEKDGSGTPYLPNAQLTMTGDLTLYAQWVYGTYTARLDYQGGSSTTGKTQFPVTYGEKFFGELPGKDTVTKAGYDFDGWATNLNTSNRIKESATWNMEDATVYARYKEKSGFTVNYDVNAPTDGTVDPSSYDPLTPVSWTQAGLLPSQTPTCPGYTCVGWTYTDEDGTTVDVGAADTYGTLAKQDTVTEITLKAKWTPKSVYTVNYAVKAPADGTVPVSYDPLTSVSWTQTGLLPSQAPACPDYAFTGWYYSDAQGNAQVANSTMAYSTLAGGKEEASVTLTAHWAAVTGQVVHYNTNGGTPVNDKVVNGTSTNLIPSDGATKKPGYTLLDWTYTQGGKTTPVTAATVYSSLSTGNSITLDANWTAKTYTINYDGLPGETETGVGYTAIVPIPTTAPSNLGYALTGWSYNGVAVEENATVSALIPADDAGDTLTLKPVWAERTYSVVYDTGSSTSAPTQTGVGYTAVVPVPASAPSKTGYDFTGWYYGSVKVESTTTIKALVGSSADSITSITLKAEYEPKTGYTVNYDVNAPAGGTVPVSYDPLTSVSWTDVELLPSPTPTCTGYTFGGWSGGRVTNVTAQTTYADIAGDDDTGKSVTLMASWTLTGYPIEYKDEGDKDYTGSKTGLPAKHDGTTTALPTPTKAGFDFGGWYLDAACENKVTRLSGTKYEEGTITLYAKWVQQTEVTGLIQIDYGTQMEQQKTKEIDVILQREENGAFVPTGKTCHVTFAVTAETASATSPFSFTGLSAADEYRVTVVTSNYEVTRGRLGALSGSTDYDLKLTYQPDNFDITMKVQVSPTVAEKDRPATVRIRVAFNPMQATTVFTDGTTVLTSQDLKEEPSASKSTWIYITEHDDASMEVPLSAGSASYSVQKYWKEQTEETTYPAYYQFVIDAYQMENGTWIENDDRDPFIVTYDQPCAYYDTATEKANTELTVTINRANVVSFDLMGGTATGAGTSNGGLHPQQVMGGKTAQDPAETVGEDGSTTSITKTGCVLDGWYTKTDWAEENRWNFGTPVTEDMTLYAHWTSGTYTVTFVNGEGEADQTKISVPYGAAWPALNKSDLPSAEGKTFAGYYTEGEDGQPDVCYYDAAGNAVNETYQIEGDITLYAHWTEPISLSGTATIDHGANSDPAGYVTIWLERRVKGSEDSYIAVEGQEEQTLTFGSGGEENQAGYTFGNLPPFDENGREYEYRVNAAIANYKTEIIPGETADVCNLEFTYLPDCFALPITVDASQIENGSPAAVKVQVTQFTGAGAPGEDYNGAGGDWEAIENSSVTLPVTDGTAGGFCNVPIPKDEDGNEVTAYYQLDIVSYAYTTESGTETVLAAAGPFFVSSYGGCFTYPVPNDSEDAAVSAEIDRTYQVTFDTQGVGGYTPVPQTVKRGEYVEEPALTEEGNRVTGWYYTEAGVETQWEFDSMQVNDDLDLFAKWETDDATNGIFVIRFYDGSEADTEPVAVKPVTDAGKLPEIEVPFKEGHAFAGYYYAGDGENGEVCYYDAQGTAQIQSYDRLQSIDLYAKWIETADISGTIKIGYTYVADSQKVLMPDPQRLGSVKVTLERKDADGVFTAVDTAEVIFEDFQGKVESAEGSFVFKNMPKADADGKEYEYRVVSGTANYREELIGEDPYHVALIFDAETFDLSMTVDAAGIACGAPVSADVKVAFIWYQPKSAFDGVVDGNPTRDPRKWRYLPEFFMEGGSVKNIPLTGGSGTITYPVTGKGSQTDAEGEEKPVVPFYYQFVITAYHMADGSVIEAGSANDPFTETWDKWYALQDTEDSRNQALTITLSRAQSGGTDADADSDADDDSAEPEKLAVTEKPTVTDPADTGVAAWLETDDHSAYLHGYTAERFGPDDNMTRAQAAQMFYNLLRDKTAAGAGSGFSDVPAGAWYEKAADTLAALGVITGYADGTFRPNQPITRAQFTVIAMRFARLDAGGEDIFSDVSRDDWFYDQVRGAVKYGWIGGYADGTFRPQATITRAQVAVIVDRMLGRSADEDYVDSHRDTLTLFADVPPSYWAYYSIVEAANAHDHERDGGGERWS